MQAFYKRNPRAWHVYQALPYVRGEPNVVGWQMRPGCAELLDRLRPEFALVLWSVSPRRYVDKALSFGFDQWFAESYSWDEIPAQWKEVRQIRADFLVDGGAPVQLG